MKTFSILTLATIAKLAAGHATLQELSVNGKAQGQRVGVRPTSNGNNPTLSDNASLHSRMIVCKGGDSAVDKTVSVAKGDKLTMQWHHNEGYVKEPEEPIAQSHKGPIITWIAKASTNGDGAAWVKIQEEGLSGGKWAVDNFYANGGKIDATIPDLLAGDYLVRSEIIALHEGDRVGKTQFYQGCAQIKVTTPGSLDITSGIDITKLYDETSPSVNFNIYGGATTYNILGPKVNAGLSAGSGSPAPAPSSTKPATSAAPTSAKPSTVAPTATAKPSTSAAPTAKPTTLQTSTKVATPTGGAGAGTVAKWGQCGGKGYTGATGCVSGSTCQVQNDYYSQCL